MKTILALLLSITIQISTYGQYVKGSVVDKKTNSRIGYATVYFNGTFVGTSADGDGNFKLNVSKNLSMPITVSAIGYYSATIEEYTTEKHLMVYLTPKSYEMQEVAVSAKSLERKRKRNLAIFKDEFLGISDNARKCEIINERDITFNYESDDDTLKAFASKPIIIENKSLGYIVTYYLDIFEYYKKSETTFFRGNIIFEEDTSANASKDEIYSRRKNTYLGSRTHFIKSLWSNALKFEGYNLQNPLNDTLNYKNIVVLNSNGNKFINYNDKIRVGYNIDAIYITFLKDFVFIDSTGYFDPLGINRGGCMGNQRVADWLPYEYSPE